MFNPETFDLKQIVDDVVYPALDRFPLGDVVLFFAARNFDDLDTGRPKTYRALAEQTGLPESVISARVGRVHRYVLAAFKEAME